MSWTPATKGETVSKLPNVTKVTNVTKSRSAKLAPKNCAENIPTHRPKTSEGRPRPPVSLLRESQTVETYLGSNNSAKRLSFPVPIAKAASPTTWASKTAASCAFTTTTTTDTGYEQVMELKRQLAHTRQDLHLTKISRSLSSGNGNAVMAMLSPTNDLGAPGSPYRTSSSGTVGNIGGKSSFSKELMQKLRSMTETIKMLSDENAQLRCRNEQMLAKIVDAKKGVAIPANNGLYNDLDKDQLVNLVLSYDEKLKSLSKEVGELQKKLKAADEAHRDVEAATQTTKSVAEKDKYKQLARRLKEERNTYRDTLEEKQKEQSELKVEMEKMSVLISELRDNCHTLQIELTECKVQKDRIDVGIQAMLSMDSKPSTRKSSCSSITAESIRKARSVYGGPKAKNVVSTNGVSDNKTRRFDRATSMSPAKTNTFIISTTKTANSGARVAKPVAKRNMASSPLSKSSSALSSPGSGSLSSSAPAQSPSKSRVSRIPQPPGRSRIPSAPRYITPPNRRSDTGGPSPPSSTPPPAPPPTQMSRAVVGSQPESVKSSRSPSICKSSPARPPSESPNRRWSQGFAPPDLILAGMEAEGDALDSKARPSSPGQLSCTPLNVSNGDGGGGPWSPSVVDDTSPRHDVDHESPAKSGSPWTTASVEDCGSHRYAEEEYGAQFADVEPPPPPPVSRVSDKRSTNDPGDYEGVDEVVAIEFESGRVGVVSSPDDELGPCESPIVPSVVDKPLASPAAHHHSSDENLRNGVNSSSSVHTEDSNPSSEENLPADDEGSRDGREQGTPTSPRGQPETTTHPMVDCTPRTRKRVDHIRQGIAARRIQRTWKHFYEELEERKGDQASAKLPAPLVAVIEEKAKIEARDQEAAECLSRNTKPTNTDESCSAVPEETAVRAIEEAFEEYHKKEVMLRAKIHTARPWQKKKAGQKADESSEEELERAYRTLNESSRLHDIRAKTTVLRGLDVDRSLFRTGKVSEMKAMLNKRRSMSSHEKSDGIISDNDDDDDVVY